MKTKKQNNSKVYLIGSGIASLASAVYLEKDTDVPAKNIIILEKDQILGGALDGAGVAKDVEKASYWLGKAQNDN